MNASLLTYMPTPCPWKNRNTWAFSIRELRAQDYPMTHGACAEKVDDAGNYRGIEVGTFRSRGLAERAVTHWKAPK